jgi:hypothetical protein
MYTESKTRPAVLSILNHRASAQDGVRALQNRRRLRSRIVWSWRWFAALLAFAGLLASPVRAENSPVQFQLTIEPLPGDFAKLEPAIRSHVLTAAQTWVDHVECKPCSIEIVFRLQPWKARGFGHSVSGASFHGEKFADKPVSEEGWAHELRTGEDPNGAQPDVEMAFDPDYFRTLWFDPDPKSRHAFVPKDKLDAMSVILHELGHAIAFNGHLDMATGLTKDGVYSPYDRWVTFDSGNFFFNGPSALKLYRKPIPLAKTKNDYHHFGEPGPHLDRKLKEDLMNGIVMEYGKRYFISELDLAVLEDCGLTVKWDVPLR